MKILADLPLVTKDQRQRITNAPRTSDAHKALLEDVTALNAVQVGGVASGDVLPRDVSIVAWNLERCLFPEESAAHLKEFAPHIVLVSEMDHGMARTKQRHTTEDMARALGMTYAYGVEFHELDLGGPTELQFCDDDFNERGWHGNGILSAVPFEKVTMIRLDNHGHWFTPDHGADPGQPRVGGRMAIAAVVRMADGPVCIVSTHLESNSDAEHRAAQFEILMNAVDGFAPDLPVVIGGDLNSGNHLPPEFNWQDELFFSKARARGYDWSLTAEGMTTRASLITLHPSRSMKLDWLCGRGVACNEKNIIPSISEQNVPLSDHDAVHCVVSLT